MDKRIRGYKYRAYPNSAQKTMFAKIFGCTRFVYNDILSWREDRWKNDKHGTSYSDMNARLNALKTQYDWLREVDSIALQQSLRHLDNAFKHFFKKQGGYPRYKKKLSEQRYRTMCVNGNIIKGDGYIRLPKVGRVRIADSQDFDGRIMSATVIKHPSRRYCISLQVEEDDVILANDGGITGLDVGIKKFCTDSNGNATDNPKHLIAHEKKLKRLQRDLSRKQKGSKNREKARLRLAREYDKVNDQREDFQHKLSRRLAIENQVVCGERLAVKNMLKNHKLAKAISDASWSSFYRKLSYKMREHGGVLVQVPTNYPSSQTCSCCGYKNKAVKNLGVRRWICPKCGASHDRDQNAAINILAKGLEMLSA